MKWPEPPYAVEVGGLVYVAGQNGERYVMSRECFDSLAEAANRGEKESSCSAG